MHVKKQKSISNRLKQFYDNNLKTINCFIGFFFFKMKVGSTFYTVVIIVKDILSVFCNLCRFVIFCINNL